METWFAPMLLDAPTRGGTPVCLKKDADAEIAALAAERDTLKQQVEAARQLVDKWNEFAFTGDEHYVAQGDGCIASDCADELAAALASSTPQEKV